MKPMNEVQADEAHDLYLELHRAVEGYVNSELKKTTFTAAQEEYVRDCLRDYVRFWKDDE